MENVTFRSHRSNPKKIPCIITFSLIVFYQIVFLYENFNEILKQVSNIKCPIECKHLFVKGEAASQSYSSECNQQSY